MQVESMTQVEPMTCVEQSAKHVVDKTSSKFWNLWLFLTILLTSFY
jgi:hypothetical protein